MSKNAVTYTKKQREQAKKEGKPLFCMAIDRRNVKMPNGGMGSMIEYTGVGDDELVEELAALMKKHIDRESG